MVATAGTGFVVVAVRAGGDMGGAFNLLGSITRAPPLPLAAILVAAAAAVVEPRGGGTNFFRPGAAGGMPAAGRGVADAEGLENKSSAAAELLPFLVRVLDDEHPELGL